MKAYKTKKMIDAGQLDVSKLSEDHRENVELMTTASKNFTVEDKQVRKMDDDMEEIFKKSKAYTEKPSKKTEKKPTESWESKVKAKNTDYFKMVEMGMINPGGSFDFDEANKTVTVKDAKSKISGVYNILDDFQMKIDPNPSKKKPDPKKPSPKKTDHKSIDKSINAVIGKSIYFQSDNDNWVKGKIIDIMPAHKNDKDKWRIEYNGPGGKEKWEIPLVSDTFTSEQIEKLIDGEEIKGYTLVKPQKKVISDFNAAIKEIDECREMIKTERAEKLAAADKPPKKTTYTFFLEKTKIWAKNMHRAAKVEKPDNDKVNTQIKNIVKGAERQIKDVLFGSGKNADAAQKAIDDIFK